MRGASVRCVSPPVTGHWALGSPKLDPALCVRLDRRRCRCPWPPTAPVINRRPSARRRVSACAWPLKGFRFPQDKSKAIGLWLKCIVSPYKSAQLGKRLMLSDCVCASRQWQRVGWGEESSPSQISPTPLYRESFSPAVLVMEMTEGLAMLECRQPDGGDSRGPRLSGRIACTLCEKSLGLRHCALLRDKRCCVCV
jgi:hypothetical protein